MQNIVVAATSKLKSIYVGMQNAILTLVGRLRSN